MSVDIEGAPGSVLAQLQLAAQEQQEARTLDLPVGGAFGSMLEIRYKPMGPDQMDRYISKRTRVLEKVGASVSDLSSTDAAMDLMAQSCVEVLGKGETLELDGTAVRLDARLAQLLAIPFPEGYVPTARDVILKLFGGNAMAIDTHSSALLDWMRTPTLEVERLGEASE